VISKLFIISQKLIDDLHLFCSPPNARIPFEDNIAAMAEDSEDNISAWAADDIREIYNLIQ
jgi:hypothetical protein